MTENTVPSVSLRQMIMWADCPMKVFWEKKYKTPRYDHDSLLRFAILKTLSTAYANISNYSDLDLNSYCGKFWMWYLTQINIPDPVALKELLDRYHESRNTIIRQTLNSNRELDYIGYPAINWWESSSCTADFFKLRNEINEFQEYAGFTPLKYLDAYPEWKRLPNTFADVYADYFDAIESFNKFRIDPRFGIEFDPLVELRLPTVNVRMNFDVVWKRPWTDDNPRSPRNRDEPENIVEYLIFDQPQNTLAGAAANLKLSNDLRLPSTCNAKKPETIGNIYYGIGSKNSGREYRINSVKYRHIPSGTATRLREEDTPELSFANLEYYARAFSTMLSRSLYVPKCITRHTDCGKCVYLRDCYSDIGQNEVFRAVSDQQESDLDDFVLDFMYKTGQSQDPETTLDLVGQAVEFLRKYNNSSGYESVCNVLTNLKSDYSENNNLEKEA